MTNQEVRAQREIAEDRQRIVEPKQDRKRKDIQAERAYYDWQRR